MADEDGGAAMEEAPEARPLPGEDPPHSAATTSSNPDSLAHATTHNSAFASYSADAGDAHVHPNLTFQGSPRMSAGSREPEAFMNDLQAFFFDRGLEFKIPKFYGDEVDLHKLWNIVHSLGGFEKVTTGKLWKYVGDRFNPPKSCTTLSWTFRQIYEKMLFAYEKHTGIDETASYDLSTLSRPPQEARSSRKSNGSREFLKSERRTSTSGKRSRNDFGDSDGEELPLHDSRRQSDTYLQLKKEFEDGHYKRIEEESRRLGESREGAIEERRTVPFPAIITDEGSADWVKINVKKSPDCFELFALVPGLMREEVRVQCEVSGKVIIAGEPEHLENPWGITPFQKVVHLPGPIDAHKTTALMTLHGQLYVKAPIPINRSPPLLEHNVSGPSLEPELQLTMHLASDNT